MKILLRTAKSQAVTLTDADYIAAGGQAAIFGQGTLIYKIYSNKKAINLPKIKELKKLFAKPNIIKPEDLLYDQQGTPVGFTMPWIRNAVSLCKVFTNTYRDTATISNNAISKLIQGIRDGIAYIHKCGCLIVDCNEYNILVDTNGHTTPYFIDTDSYQTPSYPADAVTPTIRDPHATAFSANSDWYAFAVLSCQIYTGIHPYRGTHPAYKKGDIQKRMTDNVSIFNPKVSLPSTARPLTAIPKHYRQWLEQVLEQGLRMPPPEKTTVAYVAIPASPMYHHGHGILILNVKVTCKGKIRSVQDTKIGIVIRTDKKLYAWKRIFDPIDAEPCAVVMPSGDFLAYADNGTVKLLERNGTTHTTGTEAQRLIQSGDHIAAVTRDAITEVTFTAMQGKTVATLRTRWQVHPNRQVFSTMAIQWLIGTPYLTIPYSADGRLCMAVIKAGILTDYKIIDAKYVQNLALVIGHKEGRYDQYLFRLNGDMDRIEETMEIRDTENTAANITALPREIAIHIAEDGMMQILSTKNGQTSKREIRDPKIRASLTLANEGDTVLVYEGNTLCELTLNDNTRTIT